MTNELPPEVIRGLGPDINSTRVVSEVALNGGTGAATGGVTRLQVELRSRAGTTRRVTMVRKRLAPLTSGRHAAGALEPRLNADPRMEELWRRRGDLLARLAELPRVLSHGDYALGNLIDTGRDVVALDWATDGWEPVGFDLAHLALSSLGDPTDAHISATGTADSILVMRGFTISVALTGSSRFHWMMTRSVEPPPGYADFIWHHRPRSLGSPLRT